MYLHVGPCKGSGGLLRCLEQGLGGKLSYLRPQKQSSGTWVWLYQCPGFVPHSVSESPGGGVRAALPQRLL